MANLAITSLLFEDPPVDVLHRSASEWHDSFQRTAFDWPDGTYAAWLYRIHSAAAGFRGSLGVLFGFRRPRGPIVGREADSPEVGTRDFEFESRTESLGIDGLDQLCRAFDLLVCPHVPESDDLAGFERRFHFHQGPVCVHDNRMRLFAEGCSGGQYALDDDTDLQKEALAASSSDGRVH